MLILSLRRGSGDNGADEVWAQTHSPSCSLTAPPTERPRVVRPKFPALLGVIDAISGR